MKRTRDFSPPFRSPLSRSQFHPPNATVTAQAYTERRGAGMSAQPLTLVSFADSSHSEPLRATLAASGYDVLVSQGVDWLDVGAKRASAPLVVFIAQPNFPKERLLNALKAGAPPSLAVCHPELAPLDDEVLRHCSEVAVWPCRSEELKLRLHRLIPASTLDALRESDNAVCGAFF